MAHQFERGTLGARPRAEIERLSRSTNTARCTPGKWGGTAPLLLLGAITLAGILIRVPSFSDSLFGDELSAYFIVTGHGVGRIVDLVQSDEEVTPPLYFLLAHLTQWVGDPVYSLRWVPMLSGIASIPLTYVLGIQTVGRRAALTAAAIMALSPFLIFYSSEARPYGLLMLLCLGSTLALIRAVEGAGPPWWVLYAALSCSTMYTHYTGAFVLIGQAAWALAYHRASWRWLIGSNIAAALAWAPWLSSYRADQKSPGARTIGLLQPFDFGAVKTDVLHWVISHPLTAFSVRDMPGDRAIVLVALGLAIGLVGSALRRLAGGSGWGCRASACRSCSSSLFRPLSSLGSTAPLASASSCHEI